MTDGEPPIENDDPPTKPGRVTAEIIRTSRFPARDEDFIGANDEALAIQISLLETEHRDLDAAIRSLEDNSPYERLTIARLKKKKLQLKDKLQELKDQMLPDIIA